MNDQLSCFRNFSRSLFILWMVCFVSAGTPHTIMAQSVRESPLQADAVSTKTVSAAIDLSQSGPPIDRLMYGHFIENLSNWFEGGLWAEMLGDRKFFYPVNNKEKHTPPNSRRGILGQWTPLGSLNAIKMDQARPYVGKQSPKISVYPNQKQGIQQAGLPLEKGKKYEGRIVLASTTSLAGAPGPAVTISLVWGDGSGDRQSVTIDTLSADYETYNFTFAPKADTRKGHIEISGTGTGSFWIGAVSLMPADNIDGFRPDLLALLREMGVTFLRWGGNHSSGYDWRNGIGDRDKRPPRYDYAWQAVDQNDVGTFEFLDLCKLIGATPDIGVNAGFGDAHSASQWVQYVNGSKDTKIGKLRARHGHPEPFNVKWWGIGNEMYGEWQLGHMDLKYYEIKHNQFARAMRKVDPNITLVASGATPYEMNTISRHFHHPPHRPIKYGSRFDWTSGLLKHSAKNFDYIAEHIYPLPRKAFDEEKQKFVETDDPLIDVVRRPANRVKGAVEAWHKYQQEMPWLKNSDKQIVLDEWVTGLEGLPDALGVGIVLNELFRHTDVFKMSAYTCAPCALTYNGTDAGFRARGLVFKLYSSRFGSIPVKVRGNSLQKEVAGTVGVDKPSESSGSETWPLDIMAALNDKRDILTISVVNPTGSEQELDLAIDGGTVASPAQKWIITGPNLKAKNQAGKKPQVTLKEQPDETLKDTIQVSPLSINLFKVKLK